MTSHRSRHRDTVRWFDRGRAARRHWLTAGILCLALGLRFTAAAAADALREVSGAVLTNALQVRALTFEEANRFLPVRIRGVVTFMDSEWGMMFVQDSTAGVYVMNFDLRTQLPAGQMVEVSGVSNPGAYSPVISRAHVGVLGPGHLPNPLISTIRELGNGKADGYWVEVRGVVGSALIEEGRLALQIAQGRDWMQVLVRTVPPGWRDLVNARVRLQGVCTASADEERRLTGVQLSVPDGAQVMVEEPAPKDLFALPIQPITEVLKASSAPDPRGPIRVQAAVQTNGLAARSGFETERASSGWTRCVPMA